MKNIIRLDWEESELGWGVRPDGFSLHLTEADAQRYVDAYWKRMPDAVPDEYERPTRGAMFAHEVSDKTYERVAASEFGIRCYRHQSCE